MYTFLLDYLMNEVDIVSEISRPLSLERDLSVMGDHLSKPADDASSRSELKKVISFLRTANTLARLNAAGKIAQIAAKKGNLNIVHYIAEKEPAALAEKNSNGKTVAHIAAKQGRLDIIQYVAQKRPSVLLEEGEGIVKIARKYHHLEIILCVARENPSVLANEDSDGNTLLHLLAEENYLDAETLSFFVNKGTIALSKTNKKRETIAHIAARNGNLDLVRCLALIDPTLLTMKDYRWSSVIQLIAYYAAENGRLQMIQRIIEENPNALNTKFPPFCRASCFVAIKAAHGGHCDIVQCVVEKYPEVLDHNDVNDGGTIAQIAARSGHLELVLYLVEKKPSFVAEKDQNDNTVLHLAAMANAENVRAFEFLVEQGGVSLLDRNKKWETVLDIAVRKGNIKLIHYLNQKIHCVIKKKSNYRLHKSGNTRLG